MAANTPKTLYNAIFNLLFINLIPMIVAYRYFTLKQPLGKGINYFLFIISLALLRERGRGEGSNISYLSCPSDTLSYSLGEGVEQEIFDFVVIRMRLGVNRGK